jgi:hypothetical protein
MPDKSLKKKLPISRISTNPSMKPKKPGPGSSQAQINAYIKHAVAQRVEKMKPVSSAKQAAINAGNKARAQGKPNDKGRTTQVIKTSSGKYKAVTTANNKKQESITRATPPRAMSAANRGNAAAKRAAAKKTSKPAPKLY